MEIFPTAKEMKRNGKARLVRATQCHGDTQKVASRLGMRTKYKTRTCWKNFGNVGREIMRLVQRCSGEEEDTTVLPGDVVLKKKGFEGLIMAVKMYWGRETVEKRLGIS